MCRSNALGVNNILYKNISKLLVKPKFQIKTKCPHYLNAFYTKKYHQQQFGKFSDIIYKSASEIIGPRTKSGIDEKILVHKCFIVIKPIITKVT